MRRLLDCEVGWRIKFGADAANDPVRRALADAGLKRDARHQLRTLVDWLRDMPSKPAMWTPPDTWALEKLPEWFWIKVLDAVQDGRACITDERWWLAVGGVVLWCDEKEFIKEFPLKRFPELHSADVDPVLVLAYVMRKCVLACSGHNSKLKGRHRTVRLGQAEMIADAAPGCDYQALLDRISPKLSVKSRATIDAVVGENGERSEKSRWNKAIHKSRAAKRLGVTRGTLTTRLRATTAEVAQLAALEENHELEESSQGASHSHPPACPR